MTTVEVRILPGDPAATVPGAADLADDLADALEGIDGLCIGDAFLERQIGMLEAVIQTRQAGATFLRALRQVVAAAAAAERVTVSIGGREVPVSDLSDQELLAQLPSA